MARGPIHMVGWYRRGDADFAAVWFTVGGKRAFWKNDEYEKLFVEARSTVDEEARLASYHRMMEIMHEEAPAIFLFLWAAGFAVAHSTSIVYEPATPGGGT